MERLPKFLYSTDQLERKELIESITEFTKLLHHFLGLFPPPIAARKVMSKRYADPHTVIPIATIVYAFSGSATTRGLIDAPWIGAQSFRSGHVYIRTRTGVFFVHYRSLAELLERLGAARFYPVHQSLFVNLHESEIRPDLDGERKRVGVAVNEKTEWLVVSRRRISGLREILGLPRRSWKDRKWSTGTA